MSEKKLFLNPRAQRRRPKTTLEKEILDFEKPREVIQTVISFHSLNFPPEVRACLAEAFWSHFGVRPPRSILTSWSYLKIYNRFQLETNFVKVISDQNSDMLCRYVEWLYRQSSNGGAAWSKSSMSAAYSTLRSLFQWIARCKPGLLPKIEYPFNPFPWRNRDSKPRSKMPPSQIRCVIKACENEIAALRYKREDANNKKKISEDSILQDEVESGYLFPSGRAILPYYLLIIIHAAGNPDAILSIRRDCLQPIPLLEDREALVWFKARSNSFQRRTFKIKNRYEPPALVKELLAWNEPLTLEAPLEFKDRLFLYRTGRRITALTAVAVKYSLKKFCSEHSLPLFSLSSIRPGVLSSIYRASGDLRNVQAAANHRNISTTIRYVENPEVMAQNQLRVLELQSAFIAHIEKRAKKISEKITEPSPPSTASTSNAISMYGFDCKDPYSGVAPGTKKGELCESFLGCFTCPNAVIKSDSGTIARLLQARDHLKSAANQIHPARWNSLYLPQLQILEEDILTKFSENEIQAAKLMLHELPKLLDLR